MKWHTLFAIVCVSLSACGADVSGDADSTEVNVTGTWRGQVQLRTSERTSTFSVIFQLNQSGSTVTGTSDSDPRQENTTPGAFTGSVSGKTLTGRAFGSRSPKDDCGNYAADFIAEVNGNTMTVKSGSGYDCEGDNVGGHSKLLPGTVTGGTLNRQ